MENYPIPNDLLRELKLRSSFILLGHKNPDGDCLGSQLVLGSFLTRIGKKVSLVSPGPFDRKEIKSREKLFLTHVPERRNMDDTLVIILDCSSVDRIGYLADEISDFTVAVVDHHNTGSDFGDIKYIKPSAPSVTFLVHEIIKAFSMVPNTEEAKLLLFGIATDTGFFRHLESGTDKTFQTVSELIKQGASPKDAYTEMYGGRSLESKILLGRLLTRIKTEFNGKLVISYETKKDLTDFGTENRDSDIFYQQIQGVENVEVIVLIRYEDTGEFSVGLRSKHYADIGSVAKFFGGGGHKKAAGFTWNGSPEEITIKLIEKLGKIL